jgi:hypothetical protein
VTEALAEYIGSHEDAIASEVTSRMEKEAPGLFCRYETSSRSGRDPRAACKEDTVHHLRSLSAALDIDDPREFARYRTWLVGLLGVRGIPEEEVDLNFKVIADVLTERVGESEAATVVSILTGAPAKGPSL